MPSFDSHGEPNARNVKPKMREQSHKKETR